MAPGAEKGRRVAAAHGGRRGTEDALLRRAARAEARDVAQARGEWHASSRRNRLRVKRARSGQRTAWTHLRSASSAASGASRPALATAWRSEGGTRQRSKRKAGHSPSSTSRARLNGARRGDAGPASRPRHGMHRPAPARGAATRTGGAARRGRPNGAARQAKRVESGGLQRRRGADGQLRRHGGRWRRKRVLERWQSGAAAPGRVRLPSPSRARAAERRSCRAARSLGGQHAGRRGGRTAASARVRAP